MQRAMMDVENARGRTYGWPSDVAQSVLRSGLAEALFGPDLRDRLWHSDWRLGVEPAWEPAETLVGWADDALEFARQKVGNPSFLPMNIQPRTWSALGLDRRDGLDAKANIRAGASLLSRIAQRIPDPDPAKVASVYNFAGRERVSEPGAAAARAYHTRPWAAGRPGDPDFPDLPVPQ